MEYLVNWNSAKNAKSKKERKNISTNNMKYVYGQLEKYGDFKKNCVFALARANETASIYKRKVFKITPGTEICRRRFERALN